MSERRPVGIALLLEQGPDLLIYDPEDPAAIVQKLKERYDKAGHSGEPVAVLELLSLAEREYLYEHRKRFQSGTGAVVEHVLKEKVRQRGSNGGGAEKRLIGLDTWLEERVAQRPNITARELWDQLKADEPRRKAEDGEFYTLTVEDGRLHQIVDYRPDRTADEVPRTYRRPIKFTSFRTYVTRAKGGRG